MNDKFQMLYYYEGRVNNSVLFVIDTMISAHNFML